MKDYAIHWLDPEWKLPWKERVHRFQAADDADARSHARTLAHQLGRKVATLRDCEASSGNHEAEPGTVWVCGACGKRSRDKYGFKKIDGGWDESCMLNSVLCEERNGDSPWVAVDPQPGELSLG